VQVNKCKAEGKTKKIMQAGLVTVGEYGEEREIKVWGWKVSLGIVEHYVAFLGGKALLTEDIQGQGIGWRKARCKKRNNKTGDEAAL